MIPVVEAQALCLADLPVTGTETVALRHAAGRMLAAPVTAHRAQPPFPASAMDGYAVMASDVRQGAQFRVIGEAAAGHGFAGPVGAGEAVRIFTGAPVPEGADFVVIQEDALREGDMITLRDALEKKAHIRPEGADFPSDFTMAPPRLLSAPDLALLAAMNAPEVQVRRKPEVAIIATGDELVMPGGDPGPDQIIASNLFALAAMVEAAGGVARLLPIARDDRTLLAAAFSRAASADLVVSIGGASVGDHDLVAEVAGTLGITLAFHKIAMRPGKPLMLGHGDGHAFLGLPGNPVSAIVCGHLFLVPMVRAMLGVPDPLPRPVPAVLAHDLGPNGPREHYMRARRDGDALTVFDRQDSSLLSVLTQANCLAIRPPHDGPRRAGETLDTLAL